MKKILIAFDIDGTLRNNSKEYDHGSVEKVKPNERIRSLLVTLASFKNVDIIVWSGGGQLYAKQVVRELGLAPYVKMCFDKAHATQIQPDIAIDDIQECDLAKINLIVREK